MNILNKNNNVLRKLLFYEFSYKPQLIIFNKIGKVIIIIGGYGVLGSSIAKHLVEPGAKVVILVEMKLYN